MYALLKAPKFSMPIAGLDIFALMVLLMLVNQPVFDVGRASLPELQREESAAANNALPPGHHVELKRDGAVTFDGEVIALEHLAEMICKTEDAERPVYLSLETDADGNGPVQSLLQAQLDLARAGLLNRVELLTKPVSGGRRITRGLSRFSRRENGTVPLPNREVIHRPPLSGPVKSTTGYEREGP